MFIVRQALIDRINEIFLHTIITYTTHAWNKKLTYVLITAHDSA